MYRVILTSYLLVTQVNCRTYPTQTQSFAPTQTTPLPSLPSAIIQTPTTAYNPHDILLLHQRILNALSNSIDSLLATSFIKQPNQIYSSTYGPPNGASLFNPPNGNLQLQPGNENAHLYQHVYPQSSPNFGQYGSVPQRPSQQQIPLPVASYPFNGHSIKPIHDPLNQAVNGLPLGYSPFGSFNPSRSIAPFVVSAMGHFSPPLPQQQSPIPIIPAIGFDNFADANEQSAHIVQSQENNDIPASTQVPSNNLSQPMLKVRPIENGLDTRSIIIYEDANHRETTARQIPANSRSSASNAGANIKRTSNLNR